MAQEATHLCQSCGRGVADEKFAERQLAQFDDAPVPMCRECINTNARRVVQTPFDKIRENLSPENRREWDDWDFETKFLRFLKYRKEGVIQPSYAEGLPESMNVPAPGEDVIRLKAFELRET